MKIQDLLQEKSRPVLTIDCGRSVDDAVSQMADKRVDALIAMDKDQPVGIFAERDVFRYFLKDRTTALSDIPLRDALAEKLIAAKPEDDVSSFITIMFEADIKHLPVMKKKKIIGMLTLHDLIKQQLESLTAEIHQLKDYIEDLHEAGRD